MTLGRPCPVVPLGAGERSSVGGGGGWAQPTRPLPGFARQRACFSGRGLRPRPEKRRRPPGLPGGLPGGGGVWQARGRPPGPPPRRQTNERGPGPKAPGPARSGRFASSRRPPSGRVSSNAKKAREKPGPTIYGAWPMKRCQEGARQRPHPSGKARAHALGARAASSVPPRATTASRQQPLLRDYRRARSTAVGVAPPWA